MGGFSGSNPLVNVGARALDVYTGVPIASAALGVADARSQQQAQQAALQQTYDMQAASLQRQQQQQVRERQDLLKRTLASQRARLGAMGISGGGGSADALAAGLTQQAVTGIADIQGDFADRRTALDWKFGRQQAQMDEENGSYWTSLLTPVVINNLPGRDNEKRSDRRQSTALRSLI